MITVRFWFGNLFATWIFVVLISSWRNSTLSVRSSDMSSSKRGIVLNSLIVLNKDEERTELDEMVVLDVGSINWICFWDRKETKNSSQRADVNIKYQVNIKWWVLASTSYSWNLKSKLGTRHQKNGALPSGSKWSVKGGGEKHLRLRPAETTRHRWTRTMRWALQQVVLTNLLWTFWVEWALWQETPFLSTFDQFLNWAKIQTTMKNVSIHWNDISYFAGYRNEPTWFTNGRGKKNVVFLGQIPKRGGQGSASPWFCLKKKLVLCLKNDLLPLQ